MAEEGTEDPKPKRRKAKPKGGGDEQPLTEISSNSKMKLDQLLQQVVTQSTKDAADAKKKKKKKPKNQEDDNVLESLRKAEGLEGLHKERDTAILANTYDPDDNSKSEKSNKQRQRRQNKNKQANLNEEKQNTEVLESIAVTDKKKKKPKKKDVIEDEMEKELVKEAEQQAPDQPARKTKSVPLRKAKSPTRDAHEEKIEMKDLKSGPTSPPDTPKKKKKKKPEEENVEEEQEEEDEVEEKKKEVAAEEEGGRKKKKHEAVEEEEEEEKDNTKKQKKKKKTPRPEEETAEDEESEKVDVEERKKKKKTPSPEEETAEEEESEKVDVKEKKKKKKKPPKSEEEGIEEDEEKSGVVEAPIAKPREKKQKKARQMVDEDGDETAKAKEKDDAALKKSKQKKKSAKPDIDEEQEEKPEEEESEAVKAKPRKKKKKDDEEASEGEKSEDKTADEEETTKDKKKKKKKLKTSDEDKMETQAQSEPPPDIEDEGEVMALMVHRTDKLKNDFRILHPVVRVHVLNEITGEYIPKQHPDRAVTSYFETSNEAVKNILPMMTQPFDFKERKSTIPVWEDLLVFNENFNYFVQPNPKVILLFELLDFVSMNTASRQFSDQKEEGGWHRIAWAFLKVLGKNEKVNIGNKLRLQLFVPPNKSHRVPGQPEVYQWLTSGQRTPYPSTLYVTLKSITPPREVSGATRSMFATQEELGHMTYKDLKSMNWSGRDKSHTKGRTLTTWTRLLGQLCRVPNSLSLTMTAGKKGCFVIKFSNDGRSLACACQNGTDYPILVYEIPSGTLKGQFQGHFGIIYSLSWSKNDTQLLSASNDGTARVWDLQKLGENQIRLLPHPGFVYTAEFHPRVDSIIVSGGYDEVVRVWDISMPEDYNVLQQEMEEHHGHINSVCFDPDDGQKMYSADSVGTILIWNVFVSEQTTRKHFVRDWTKYQEIKDPELVDTPINYIKMHPSGRRLLVHGRNNAIYMFDLRVQRVMQKYFGADNLKEKICSTITPCGSFVFSGSEDGKVYVWNTDTGDQVAMYTQLNYLMPVTDVDYHPRDHMLAICSLGDNHPIYVYKYDPLIAQADVSSPRPSSPVETTDIEALETTRMSALKEVDLQSARSKVLSKEEFETQEKARYLKVVKKLDTATMQMSQMPGMVVPEALLSPRMDTIGRSGIQSTWKMPYDSQYTLSPRPSAIPPGVLSPHAPAGSGTQLATQINSHRGYMRAADGDWRPGFSEMGRHGQRSQSPTIYGRPPHLSLSTSLGKPQFTFESPVGKSAKRKQVVAMYDYRAQRSDELTLFKGDVITVLYKDNDNWWMGELEDGQQGFFPANYVTEDEDPEQHRKSRKTASTTSSSSTVTAVRTKTGELKFVSGGEESDSEAPRRQKKRVTLSGAKENDGQAGPPTTSQTRLQLDDSIDALLDQYESVA